MGWRGQLVDDRANLFSGGRLEADAQVHSGGTDIEIQDAAGRPCPDFYRPSQ